MSKQSISCVFRLLEFIRRNTDRKHPATQADLRRLAGEEAARAMMGDKGTFTRRLREIGDAYNRTEKGELLSKEEWKVVYPGYDRPEGTTGKNGKIYYAHEVSDYEMDFLLSQIRKTPCLTAEEKESLEKRLTGALCSRYYQASDNGNGALIRSVNEEVSAPDASGPELSGKLKIIREHILRRKMLELEADQDGEQKKSGMIRVSPYRLLYSDCAFWLVGNRHEQPQSDVPWPWYTDVLTAFRVDRIHTLRTAHTPDRTFIHWKMTHNNLRAESYTRESYACRETKARRNPTIVRELEQLDHMEQVTLQHMENIQLPKSDRE